MSSGGMFVGMNNTLTEGLTAILQGQSSVYGTMISTIAVSSFTLFVIYKGYQTLAGKLHTPVEDLSWDIGRMLIIMTFVLNRDGWLSLAISAIDGLKEGLSGHDNIWALLDSVWQKAQTIGQRLYQQDDATYVKLNGGIAEILVWGGAMVTLLCASVVNLLASMTLLLMTTTAPLFIFCLLYGFLTPMFNHWLQILFTALLTILFSALSIRVLINYLNTLLDKAVNFVDSANIITLGVQCCVAGIVSGIIIWFSAVIAQALSGVAVQATLQGAAIRGLSKVSVSSAAKYQDKNSAGSGAKNTVSTHPPSSDPKNKTANLWRQRTASINNITQANRRRSQ